jgi:hypothetical protein
MKFAVEIMTRGVDYPRFRRVYHSEAFNQAVAETAKLKERSLKEHVMQPDGKERRRVRVVPNVTLPAPVQKLLNDGEPLSYEEVTVFDPKTRSATYTIESSAGEKLQVTGQARFNEEADGVRLRFDGEAKVNVFGVGSIIERFIIGEVKSRYEIVEKLMQSFIDEHRDQDLASA